MIIGVFGNVIVIIHTIFLTREKTATSYLVGSFDITPPLSKGLKIYLIFSTYLHKSSKSFLYRFGVLCPLCIVIFLYKRVFEKNCSSFYMSKGASKHFKIVANSLDSQSRPEYGNLRTTVRIRVFTDRMATNHNACMIL